MGRVKKILSRCRVWGGNLLNVLITIGTMTDLKFTRLFEAIDNLCSEGVLDGEKVTAQIGAETYTPKYFSSFEMIEDQSFKKMIEESDLIITHAGTGTVTTCLKKGKKVIIFPRMKKYQEHYDDHQLELSEVFSRKGYALKAYNEIELKNCIQNIADFTPEPFVSNNQQMNQLVIRFIEEAKENKKKRNFFSFQKSI